jgi:hypothetical protein
MEFGDVRNFRCESHVTECMTRLAIKVNHKDMIIARKLNFQERRILAQLIMLITLLVEWKISLALYRVFWNSQLGKREFANLYYKGFSIIFRIEFLQFLASNIAQPKYKDLDRSMMRVLLEVATPLSTTIYISNQTLMFTYKKLKMNKRVKQEKHHKRKKFKWLFLFDFLWRKH